MDTTRVPLRTVDSSRTNSDLVGPTAAWQRSVFGLLHWLRVECPLCGRVHPLWLYRHDLDKLAEVAGGEALEARLDLLSRDRPLVRCPECVVRWGGEDPQG